MEPEQANKDARRLVLALTREMRAYATLNDEHLPDVRERYRAALGKALGELIDSRIDAKTDFRKNGFHDDGDGDDEDTLLALIWGRILISFIDERLLGRS
jgi:hypothetical protein